VAEIGKKLPKMEFFDFFEKVLFFTVFVLRMSDVFHDLKNVKKAEKSRFEKKVGKA
jgi:hypothetical protein